MTETKRLADELEALAKECDAYPEGPGHVNRMYDLGERTRNNLPLILTTLREAEGMRAPLSEREVGREALIRLANAADHYGIANLDTDDLDEEAEELQAATEVARKALSLLGGE